MGARYGAAQGTPPTRQPHEIPKSPRGKGQQRAYSTRGYAYRRGRCGAARIFLSTPTSLRDFAYSEMGKYVQKAEFGTADLDKLLETMARARLRAVRGEEFFWDE